MKEYGGYLPLELPLLKEYYNDEDHMIRVNCGRSAIYCALLEAKPSKVYLPYYNCEFVKEPFEKLGIPYCYYNIDRDFMPIGIELLPNEYILWVNYFGTQHIDKAIKIVERFKNVILDNTQAFYAKPIKEVYNIYSCRKFFGVSDGAYVIKNNIVKPHLQQDESYKKIEFILKCIERGTDAGYKDYIENEDILATNILKMSKLTQRILESIDYEYIQKKRYDNFKWIHELLKDINQLDVDMSTRTPMVYPLVIKNGGLRNHLIENKIYVPQWWKHVMDKTDSQSFDYYLSKYLIPLPIDQRYSKKDMEYIANVVKGYVRKVTGED